MAGCRENLLCLRHTGSKTCATHYPLSTNHYPLTMPDIIAELTWRKLINQTTDDENLPRWLSEMPRTLYAGFDPTADSLQVGNLVPLMILRRFQKAGHRPIVLVGGATGMIGDPSGQSEERNLLSVEVLQGNTAAIDVQLRRFLDFDSGASSAILVNNYDWIGKCGYVEFLRDVGKHVPVGVMLAKDSVKSRLQRADSGMSYTEFSYMLLQAYDFVHLHDEFDCRLQIGGSDQWGNITAGIDLARRLRSVQLYGLTCPLLVARAGEDRPRLGDGVDPTFVVLRRSERRPVVEEGAPVPLPVPRLLFQRDFERSGPAPPPSRALFFATEVGDAGEVPQVHEEKPAQPDAFSTALMADAVHAVVPVAGPDQGKAMATDFEAAVQSPRAVLVQRRPLF